MTDEALVVRLAGVLRGHEVQFHGMWAECRCGDWSTTAEESPDSHDEPHRAHVAAELVAVVREVEAAAWSLGHLAGRDYQGDGWNSDAHDPEEDNPYRGGTT